MAERTEILAQAQPIDTKDETDRVRKIGPDLYTESVAINAIWRLIGEIPESKILLLVYPRKLLVAADFNINFFIKYSASSHYRVSWYRIKNKSIFPLKIYFSYSKKGANGLVPRNILFLKLQPSPSNDSESM